MWRTRLSLAACLAVVLAGVSSCEGTLELDPIAGDWRLDAVQGHPCTLKEGSLEVDSDLAGGVFVWISVCMAGDQSSIADVLDVRPEAGQGQYTVDLMLREGDIPLRWACTVIENTQTMNCLETVGNDALTFEFSRP